jgi:hypothetical protein
MRENEFFKIANCIRVKVPHVDILSYGGYLHDINADKIDNCIIFYLYTYIKENLEFFTLINSNNINDDNIKNIMKSNNLQLKGFIMSNPLEIHREKIMNTYFTLPELY